MSDNSFEKKVRQELQEFRVTPSDKVWAGLEAGLKERKRRRGGPIWFLLGTLLLSGGVWLAVKQSPDPAEKTIAENAGQTISEPPVTGPVFVEDNQPSTGGNEVITENKRQPQSITPTPISKSGNSSRNITYSSYKRTPTDKNLQNILSKQEIVVNPSASDEMQSQISGKAISQADPAAGENPGNEERTKEAKVVDQQQPVVSGIQQVPDSFVTVKNEEKKIYPGAETGAAVQSKKKKLEKPKRWELSLTGGAGLSEVTSGFLQEGTKSSDPFSSAGNFGPTMPLSYDHTQERSYGISGGAEVRRWLNKSVALSAGVQYQFQRTNSLVGTMSSSNLIVNNGAMDLTVDRFYLPGALTEYRNRYHLIDLPLQVQMAWGHKKLPFIAGIGIQPGILVGSNALIKDRSDVLFTDKENFNRFQFGFNGGISVRLMKNSKMPLEVGPHLQYRITNVFKDETGYKGHLFYFGLQAKWRLFSF